MAYSTRDGFGVFNLDFALKKHFLVVWPTIRNDHLKTFRDLKDSFQFTFLPSTFPQQTNFADDFECVYWSTYRNAQELLNSVSVEGIIFMSIESGLSMILNFEAQKQGKKTYILQHGIFTNYRDYRIRERLWKKRKRAQLTRTEQESKGFSTLQFIRESLTGWNRLWLFPLALYTQLQQRVGPNWAAKHLPLRIKRASTYLCFSPYNATIHRETDRVEESQILYIGSSELMGFLKKEETLNDESFYLHIDQALSENSFGEETVSKNQMIAFYEKLNDFCLHKETKLYIKLHPESYQSTWLPKHDNIYYLRGIDNLNQYIQSALGCFGFYSTIVIPAIYWKPTILFKIQYSGLQNEISQLNAAQILEFDSFQVENLSFLQKNLVSQEKIKQRFVLPDGVNENTLYEVLNAG